MAARRRKRRRKHEGFKKLSMTHKTHRNLLRLLVANARRNCPEDVTRQRMASVIETPTRTKHWSYVFVPDSDVELLEVFVSDLRAFGDPERKAPWSSDDLEGPPASQWRQNEVRLCPSFQRLADDLDGCLQGLMSA